jgi:hypothetical protein
VHGDYDAIAGGWSGEAVEDLTGGVTTKILTDRVLDKQLLWGELLQAGKKFLFSASSPSIDGDDSDARRGLALSHSYSILKAVDAEGEDGKNYQLVLIRNPWGKRMNASMGEWTGPWSDGSREWTTYWMDKLDHKFGDDGLFWMSYKDLLKRFDLLDRTRLFNEEWTVVQRWTSVPVAWVTGYVNTKFSVEIKRSGPTVFVLCQVGHKTSSSFHTLISHSWMSATSRVWRESMTSICTSYCKTKMRNQVTISCALAVPGSAIVASPLKLS